ncbi:hypothetical protein ACOPJQ_02430 [Luteimonas dalianensis]|uniref:hypothetical protein n=1 Tax=Luteimonas dalianensis TaxID=1148196 RepID=UPI003BEF92B3
MKARNGEQAEAVTQRAVSAYGALYGRSVAELAKGLAEVGEAMADQLSRLEAAPDPDECERVARNLEGAARACMRLREALQRQGGGHG